jgi:hypothetical protein
VLAPNLSFDGPHHLCASKASSGVPSSQVCSRHFKRCGYRLALLPLAFTAPTKGGRLVPSPCEPAATPLALGGIIASKKHNRTQRQNVGLVKLEEDLRNEWRRKQWRAAETQRAGAEE